MYIAICVGWVVVFVLEVILYGALSVCLVVRVDSMNVVVLGFGVE